MRGTQESGTKHNIEMHFTRVVARSAHSSHSKRALNIVSRMGMMEVLNISF